MMRDLKRFGCALTIFVATGCSTEVTNPGPVEDEYLLSRDAATALVNGAGRALGSGINWISYTSAAVTREIHPAGSTGSFGITNRWQGGELNADDGDLDTHWEQAQRARWLAEEAVRRLEAVGVPGPNDRQTPVQYYNALQLAYVYAGFANRVLGENMCEGTIDGGPKVAASVFLTRAESLFAKAIAVTGGTAATMTAQRTAAWAEVARRLAHEIKNPLTPIQLSAERLAYKLADRLDDEGREVLERGTRTIVNQVEAMKNMVNDFRDYAKLPSPVLGRLDLNALVGEVLNLYESSPVMIRAELGRNLPPVAGDASQMRQVIHNLLQNAEDALAGHEDGVVTLTTRLEGDRVVLHLRDNGPGFPAPVLTRAFEPYFTTKSRGTGLGLAMVKKIIDEHGGEVRLLNGEAGGAEVRIRLRLASAEM